MNVLAEVPAVLEVEGRSRSETKLGRHSSHSNRRVIDLGDVHSGDGRIESPPLVLVHHADSVHGVILSDAPIVVVLPHGVLIVLDVALRTRVPLRGRKAQARCSCRSILNADFVFHWVASALRANTISSDWTGLHRGSVLFALDSPVAFPKNSSTHRCLSIFKIFNSSVVAVAASHPSVSAGTPGSVSTVSCLPFQLVLPANAPCAQ